METCIPPRMWIEQKTSENTNMCMSNLQKVAELMFFMFGNDSTCAENCPGTFLLLSHFHWEVKKKIHLQHIFLFVFCHGDKRHNFNVTIAKVVFDRI